MQIGPKISAVDLPDGVEQMMMIAPVNAQEHKTQEVA
jgi:hypothetical protein